MKHDPSSSSNRPGRLIVIEGIDGTGKTTLAQALCDALCQKGEDVVMSFEPTRGPYGQRIRQLATEGRGETTPEEETELFVADRREHVAQVIGPALERGATVVLDRYYYSTMAYQGARGMDPEAIHQLHKSFAPEPDALIILELPVSEALARITQKRGSTPDAFEGEAYLGRVSKLFDSFDHPNVLRLDARQPTEHLVARILNHLSCI